MSGLPRLPRLRFSRRALAIAADSGPAYLLAGATMLVYWLMILLEEPWLVARYGDAYRGYCGTVPRLFNWRRLFAGR